MYSLQYWHSGAAEWRPCGVYSQDREVVAQRLLAHRRDCRDAIRFRVLFTPELPTLAG